MADLRADAAEPRPPRPWRYERGTSEFDRTVNFTDAVFAIAMTLLIVAVGAPALGDATAADAGTLLGELRDLAPALFSFFLAFVLLAQYWLAHHAFVAVLGGVDRRILVLNLTYLAFVAFLPFPTDLIGEYFENPISVALFALTLALISGMEAVLMRHAYRAGLLRAQMDESTYRYALLQSAIPVALFVLSIPVGFVSSWAAVVLWLFPIGVGYLVDRRFPDEARKYERLMRSSAMAPEPRADGKDA